MYQLKSQLTDRCVVLALAILLGSGRIVDFRSSCLLLVGSSNVKGDAHRDRSDHDESDTLFLVRIRQVLSISGDDGGVSSHGFRLVRSVLGSCYRPEAFPQLFVPAHQREEAYRQRLWGVFSFSIPAPIRLQNSPFGREPSLRYWG